MGCRVRVAFPWTLEVFGTDYPTPDGTAIPDYVRTLDLADADLRSLEYLESGGETTVLNLGTEWTHRCSRAGRAGHGAPGAP